MREFTDVSWRHKTTAVVAAVLFGLLATIGAVAVPTAPASAADLSQFKPGNIISDAVFHDSSTMSQAQIQSFLNSKVSSCAAGKTCLKDFSQTTYDRAADAMCNGYRGAANERAALIIYKVAQSCGVNPQVILVMLQKEQGLVQSSAPSAWAWQASMGYACPDTAACDTKYFGFYNQVYMGMWQLKRYGNPPGTSNYFTWFPIGKAAPIRFSPNASCGSANVVVENKATAALYYYTPYQPNAAALAAGYGASNDPACSAYGNRNFYNYFTDWFGSTTKPVDPAKPVDPMAYIDSAALTQTASAASIGVSGWAMDRANISKSIEVHVYLDKPDGTVASRALTADQSRTDVAGAYPGAGDKHGYSGSFPVSQPGTYQLCVFPITSAGATLLGCRSFEARAANAIGAFDSAAIVQSDGTAVVQVSGWGMNLNSTVDSAEMNFYVSGPRGNVKGYAVSANKPRADIDRVYPGSGANHGFDTSFPVTETGTYQICAYVNVASPFGSMVTALGCRNVTAKASSPFGAFDYLSQSISNGAMTLNFGGWAVDEAVPTTAINVDVYIDRPNGTTVGIRTPASANRQDIGNAYPYAGSAHGFSGTTPVTAPGTYKACAFAIGTSSFGAANSLLGCRTVIVPSAPVVGAFDSATVTQGTSGNALDVRGWAVDPASPKAPAYVDVYVDAPSGITKGYRLLADEARSDIGQIFPQYGAAHGLSEVVPLTERGKHVVCAFGIPVSPFGQSAAFGCRSITV